MTGNWKITSVSVLARDGDSNTQTAGAKIKIGDTLGGLTDFGEFPHDFAADGTWTVFTNDMYGEWLEIDQEATAVKPVICGVKV